MNWTEWRIVLGMFSAVILLQIVTMWYAIDARQLIRKLMRKMDSNAH